MTSDVLDLLDALVRIDSSNPSLSGGGPGESAVAAHVADWAATAGLRVEVLEKTPGRPNILVRGGRAGGRTLLLCGHLDTVGLSGMDQALVPRLENDRLYARGAYDMKAGLAAALVACRDAAANDISGEVVVAAVADEEHASIGIQEVLAHLRSGTVIDAAIVTEPTELQIGIGHRGFVWTEVEVTGVAAHGSRPHLGIDAILNAGPVLVAFGELNQLLAERPHPFLGPGNLHGSLIDGGTEESTIPDRCVFIVERRTLPGETVETVEADVDELLDACRAANPALDVTSRTTLAREPLETPQTADIVTSLQTATRLVSGRPAPVAPMSYWADSAFIAAAGISTVLYGPDGDGAHADIEWVSLAGTETCTHVLTEDRRRVLSLTITEPVDS